MPSRTAFTVPSPGDPPAPSNVATASSWLGSFSASGKGMRLCLLIFRMAISRFGIHENGPLHVNLFALLKHRRRGGRAGNHVVIRHQRAIFGDDKAAADPFAVSLDDIEVYDRRPNLLVQVGRISRFCRIDFRTAATEKPMPSRRNTICESSPPRPEKCSAHFEKARRMRTKNAVAGPAKAVGNQSNTTPTQGQAFRAQAAKPGGKSRMREMAHGAPRSSPNQIQSSRLGDGTARLNEAFVRPYSSSARAFSGIPIPQASHRSPLCQIDF